MSLWSFFFKDPKKFFTDLQIQKGHWHVITWNLGLDTPSQRRLTLEIHQPQPVRVEWDSGDICEFRFYENNKILKMRKITSRDKELKDLMNLSLHSTLKHGLEKNKDFILSPISGLTLLDVQDESRALKWVQVSFSTLLKALEALKSNKDLLLTAAFFSGKNPETQEDVLRVVAFNLDIFYYFRHDLSLEIVIFDDKNFGYGESKTPCFRQIIKVTKPQFYDEMIKLVVSLGQAGELI